MGSSRRNYYSVSDCNTFVVDNQAQKILAEYDSQFSRSEGYCAALKLLVEQLLAASGHRVHNVTARVKEREHVEAKVQRITKSYSSLSDITDVIGVRITTYFEDEVDAIGNLIEQEFKIDAANSIDKRASLDPDRFGYLSLHYVCSLSRQRQKLLENRSFIGMRCEIQIRSILQHAWAEIEHDLGYKTGAAVPAPIRRRFSRLAGLLEIADLEFTKLRTDLAAYAESVKETINDEASDLQVDQISLKEFIETDPLVQKIDSAIVKRVKGTLIRDLHLPYDAITRFLIGVGLREIHQLRAVLRSNAKRLPRQLASMQSSLSHANEDNVFFVGASVFQLFLFELAKQSKNLSHLEQKLNEFNIGETEIRPELAKCLLKNQKRDLGEQNDSPSHS